MIVIKIWMVILFIFLFSSCGSKMPAITSCIYDQPRQKFHCIDPKGNAFDMAPSDPKTDKLVAIPFGDFGIVLNFCENLKQP